VFFVLYGTGANGKSTFEAILSEAFGDYAQAAPPGLLMARKHEGHPTELAALSGARFVTATEVNAGAQWDEEKVKMLTGGDTIKARRMHEDFWEFRPTHKLWISTNHQPETRDNSIGFWRRIRMIPFTERIPAEEQDPHLLEKLRGELPGILAWAVEGCLAWQQNGLGISKRVNDATASYRHHQDLLGRFLEDCCDQGAGYRVKAQELFTTYVSWARLNREPDLSQKQFGERIRERGFEAKKASTIHYLGLRVKESLGEADAVPFLVPASGVR
jgi:putative DNA primase/helicase